MRCEIMTMKQITGQEADEYAENRAFDPKLSWGKAVDHMEREEMT